MPTSTPSMHAQKPENPDFKTELLGLVPFLRAFARSLTGNQEAADDLAQETLVKAWQSRSSFIPGTNLKAWLFTILRNQFYSDRRRAWRQAPLGSGCSRAYSGRRRGSGSQRRTVRHGSGAEAPFRRTARSADTGGRGRLFLRGRRRHLQMRRRHGQEPGCESAQDLDRDSGRRRHTQRCVATRRGRCRS